MLTKRIPTFKNEIALIQIACAANQIASLRTTALTVLNFFHRCRKKGSKALWENRSAIKSIVFGGGKKEKKKKKKKGKKNKNKSG